MSIVLKMRFVSTVYVDSNIYKVGVPFGENMTLSTQSAKLINTNLDASQLSLNRVWICPKEFNCNGLTETGTDLAITDADLPAVSNGGI